MDLVQIIISLVVVISGYLLAQRDAKQAKEIDLLFKKHDEDAAELVKLKIQIASNHYERAELDKKFDKLDATIKEGFAALGADVKELTKVMTAHLTNHPR